MSFISKQPQLEDYWRSIVLFGRNVACYKFALAKSLLDLKPASGELVRLDDLSPVYAKHIANHLKIADKQGTSGSSQFLDVCRRFNSGELSENELVELTVRYGFNNVIDAFHVVGQSDVPTRFYVDERKEHGGIRITDEFSELLTRYQAANLPNEVEARWNLVERAWELQVSRNILSVGHDEGSEYFYTVGATNRRKSVASSRDALNGYQKGKCFYCFSDIKLDSTSELYPDVDHFFPHILKQHSYGSSIDGVWNLVLSCQECNRGAGGKFAQVPTIRLLERLHRRNNFLISSHHPLRETLIQQTGSTENSRSKFLSSFHSKAWSLLIHQWEPNEKDTPYF
jgi:hypothetical protein